MEENKTKISTLRVGISDEESFKQFLKDNNFTQAQGFKHLISLIDLENAKYKLNDRAKEIEAFRDTVNKLINFYINSLEINQTTEERIREEVNKDLISKSNIINNLQEQLEQEKGKTKIANEEVKEIIKENSLLIKEADKYKEDINAKGKEIETLNSNNKMLQDQIITLNSIISEYKNLKDLNIKLEAENKELKNIHQTFKNELEQLNNKITNNKDMLIFYKDKIEEYKLEITDCKAEIAEYKTEITKYKAEIEQHKAEETKNKLKAEEYKIQATNYKDKIEEYKTEIAEHKAEIKELKNQKKEK